MEGNYFHYNSSNVILEKCFQLNQKKKKNDRMILFCNTDLKVKASFLSNAIFVKIKAVEKICMMESDQCIQTFHLLVL